MKQPFPLLLIFIFNECCLLKAFVIFSSNHLTTAKSRLPPRQEECKNLEQSPSEHLAIRRTTRRTKIDLHLSQSGDQLEQSSGGEDDSSSTEPTRIYFDIAIGGNSNDTEIIGRLVFNLNYSERMLPLHTENLIKLATGEVRSIDPRCSYLKCQFKHSPQFVETFPQYRWAHVLDGRGRNAVGRPTERIQDMDSMKTCAHSVFGGVYYGLDYNEDLVNSSEEGVVLTVPLVGAYRGSTSFSIVRVGESPLEWRERLLVNSAVVGYLESGIQALRELARQTSGPPIIVASGKL